MDRSMAAYNAIAELIDDISNQLNNFIQKTQLTPEELRWFQEDLWIEQPGTKILKMIQASSALPLKEGYYVFCIALAKKLNETAEKSQITIFDQFLLYTLAAVASLFPPVVDNTNMPVVLTGIIAHPVLTNPQMSKKLLRTFGSIIEHAEMAGINILPYYFTTIKTKVSVDALFDRVKYMTTSAESLISLLEVLPTFKSKIAPEETQLFYSRLYKLFSSFSYKYAAEHRVAIQKHTSDSLLPFVVGILQADKSNYQNYPLVAFLLPFAMKRFIEPSSPEQKELNNFFAVITKKKPKTSIIEFIYQSILQLMFFTHTYPGPISDYFSNEIKATEQNLSKIIQGKRDTNLQNILPNLAAFETCDSNCRNWNLALECIKSRTQGIDFIQFVFKSYPMPYDIMHLPEKILNFLIKEIISCDYKRAYEIILGRQRFETSLQLVKTEIAIEQLFPMPGVEILIRQFLDTSNLAQFIENALKKMTALSAPAKLYLLCRNVFLPYDIWNLLKNIEPTKIVPTLENIVLNFYNSFLEMYKKSMYNVTQVTSIFLQFLLWIAFVIKDRKEQQWRVAVPIVAAKAYDCLLIVEMFGFVPQSIIDKIRITIKYICELTLATPPQNPTKEFNEILLWLPFTQLKINPVFGLTVSLRSAQTNNIFISRVFEMIKINGGIVEAFKNTRPDAIPMVEDRLIETVEKQLLMRDFIDHEYMVGLIRTALNLAKAEKCRDPIKRRSIAANFFRILICGDFGTKHDTIAKYACEYCSVIFNGEETKHDETCLIFLLEFISKYCTRFVKIPGIVKGAMTALSAIVGSVSILNILHEDHNTTAELEKKAKKVVYAILSVLNFIKYSFQQKDSVSESIIETIGKLLQKNFDIAFDVCFQLISESEADFKQLIILAITKEFDPQKFGYGMLVTKLEYGNYAISVNRVNVSFNDMIYNSTRAYKAACHFLSYYNLHMEYFRYIIHPDRSRSYDLGLFLQAFFDFCFTEENLKQIFEYYKANNPVQMVKYIAQNPTIVSSYEILREQFSKLFTDNFLRKFLNEPGSYNVCIEKTDSQPCGQFTQDIKMSSYLDQILSESIRTMGEYNQANPEFSDAYMNFLEYCLADSSFDTLHVYGENINHLQVVQMRDANVMISIGNNSSVQQFVFYLDRIKSTWKSAENILHYIQMHLAHVTQCEILVDCSCANVDANVGRAMVSGLKGFSSKVRSVYLLNPSEEVLGLLDVAVPSESVKMFNIVNYEEALKQFPRAIIPNSHIFGIANPGSFNFKHTDTGIQVSVAQNGVMMSKTRLFFRKEVTSFNYLSLVENSDKTDDKEKRAANTIYEFWVRHAKKTRTMPFDMNFCFAELLVALSDENPRTRSEIYSVITKVIGKHNSVAKYDFTNNILSVPSTSLSDVSFFPHFLERLLSSAPEQLNEFYFVIKFCVDKLQPQQLATVALTLNKYPTMAAPVLHAATRPDVMIAMAECLLETNNTKLACILTNRLTVPHLIHAAKWHSFGYSESLAKILNEMLLYDKDIDTPNNVITFAVMHSLEAQKESFEIFARLACVAHLLYFNKNLTIPSHPNPDFFADALSVVTDSSPFKENRTVYNYFCRSVIEPPSIEIFVSVLNLLIEMKPEPQYIEYALATLERVIEAVPQRRPHIFVLAVIASRSDSENVRVRAISLMSSLLSSKNVLEEAVAFVVRSDISKIIVTEAKLQAEKRVDGVLLIVMALFKCFAEITNTKVVNEFVKKILTTQRVYSLSAFMLHQLAFTQEAVDPPADPEFCPFLIMSLQEPRCRGQIPRICRFLCDIRKRFSEDTNVFCGRVTEIAISLLENEIKPLSFGALGTLLGTYSSGYLPSPMIAKASTMAVVPTLERRDQSSLAPVAGIILRLNV